MKFIRNITLFGIIVFLSSCAVSGPRTSPTALVTTNDVGSKEGVAQRTIWLGIWLGTSDLSIAKAAKEGKITKVATVDTEIKSAFLRTTYRTVVTGE